MLLNTSFLHYLLVAMITEFLILLFVFLIFFVGYILELVCEKFEDNHALFLALFSYYFIV